MAPFPPLPRPRDLIRDDLFWRYPSACLAGEGIAHLRVWECERGADGYPVRLAMLSQTDLGASITNSAEDIWAVLVEELGHGLVVLEHWPAASDGELEEHLDQVLVVHGVPPQPHWRRIWPTPPSNPDHETFQAWMREHGQDLLDTFAGGGR